ncbi:hypothetical protein HK28_08095 [Acetobacter sp. DsW_063]|nr:hypothetical protein HK28_08095 [Acetobacter sp. DsW_063]
MLDCKSLRESGTSNFEIIVGKGGEFGAPGESTIFRAYRENGDVIKEIEARGGDGKKMPESTSEITPNEASKIFRITTLMPVNSCEIQNGCLFILGGGWRTFYAPETPISGAWKIVVAMEWTSIEDHKPRGFFVSIFDSNRQEKSRKIVEIHPDFFPLENSMWIIDMIVSPTMSGRWSIIAHASGEILSSYYINIVK